MALRVGTAGASKSDADRITVRSDFMVLFLTVLASAAALLHSHETLADSSFGAFADGVPMSMYLGFALIGFVPRLRSVASWGLLLFAWAMIVLALVSVIPRAVMIDGPADFTNHLVTHLVVVAAQIPLIVMLIRRLHGAACRWTAPTPNRR